MSAFRNFLPARLSPWSAQSANRQKYGNKVLRAYLQNRRKVFPVNPNEATVEGLQAYPDLASLPEPVHGASIITPPRVTEKVLEEASAAGIEYVWMQPGAEPADWRQRAERLGLKAIGGGPCALVILRYRED